MTCATHYDACTCREAASATLRRTLMDEIYKLHGRVKELTGIVEELRRQYHFASAAAEKYANECLLTEGRVKELESELAEQYRLNGMGQEREARLMAKVSELEKRLAAAEKFVDAARGTGMNWKVGAPYGLDALDEAIAAYDALNSTKEG